MVGARGPFRSLTRPVTPPTRRLRITLRAADGACHRAPTRLAPRPKRRIALPAFLRGMLAQHLATQVPTHPEALVSLTRTGSRSRNTPYRPHVFDKAVRTAGLAKGLRTHDLHHTRAALLIAENASPKAVQMHMCYSTIQVTTIGTGTCSPTSWTASPARSMPSNGPPVP